MNPVRGTFTSSPATSNKIPDVVIDRKYQRKYTRGKLIGKGGFAQCYEFVDTQTKVVYACKIVSKQRLHTASLKKHMEEEIHIHSSLRHKHIVDFHSHFEDDENVYMILELCTRQSLSEWLRLRQTLLDAEVQYFLRQLLLACNYLVEHRVVHRDLKPRNLLLTEEMELKVADFGMATRIRREGERKTTICGSPDYVAPEVLSRTGHSYEADVWSIGCIMYELLVGRAPFTSLTRKMTHTRIMTNKYDIPLTVSPDANALIRMLLHPEPAKRPTIKDIMQHEFITKEFLLSQLSPSLPRRAPRFDEVTPAFGQTDREPLAEKKESRADETCGCASSTPAVSPTG